MVTADDPPDAVFAFVAGLYVAALLAPALTGAAATRVAETGTLYVVLLAAFAAVTGLVATLVRRRRGAAVRLGAHRSAWALALLPAPWFLAVFAPLADAGGSALVVLATLGVALGFPLGLALASMSFTRYADAATAGAPERLTVRARLAPSRRRVAAGVVAVGGLVAATGGVLALLRWRSDTVYLVNVGTAFAAVAAGAWNERTVSVTGAGLVVGQPVYRRFRPWTRVSGVELTDEALVVRRAGWWPAMRLDRADLDDAEAVAAAVAAELR